MMRKILKKALPALLSGLICLAAGPARAEAADVPEDSAVYSLYDEEGALLTMLGTRVYVDDEYIAGDDRQYRVVSVDDAGRTAVAALSGGETDVPGARTAFASLVARAEKAGRIGMYSTHSDESYVPSDGDSSLRKDAGIYDVGNALKDALEEYGITVEYSEDTFFPHDAGAYRRSRATAEELLKDAPDALFDIHRDAIPAEQYETEIDGEAASKVRLFVGRSNPNAAENKAFARQLKAAADEQYPGLIKDIFIGKGNYNQELFPHALLLEFGTHEIDKDRAITATRYMASVINDVLYGGGKKGAAKGGGAASGILWIIGLAALAAIVYAFAATGSAGGAWRRLRRGASELTGGAIGDRPEEKK